MQFEIFIASCGTLPLLKGLQTVPEFSGNGLMGQGLRGRGLEEDWLSELVLTSQSLRPRQVLISSILCCVSKHFHGLLGLVWET